MDFPLQMSINATKPVASKNNMSFVNTPFGNGNMIDMGLPPGVRTDFLLARVSRPPSQPQPRRDNSSENRTRIAPIDVAPIENEIGTS